jgi:predicted dehydrogenase
MTQPKVRWGVLATGGIAAQFAADLALVEGAELAAVGSRSPESAAAFAERFGFARSHGSYQALAADDEVDVVYVATPHAMHFDAALACIEGGKGVLVEKPITLDLAAAARLVAAARERDVFLMEAMWMRMNPAIRKITDLIDEGAIGWISSIHADFGLHGPFPPEHRLRDPKLGGGACRPRRRSWPRKPDRSGWPARWPSCRSRACSRRCSDRFSAGCCSTTCRGGGCS